jgi:mono/diheme cytochrome c family protein
MGKRIVLVIAAGWLVAALLVGQALAAQAPVTPPAPGDGAGVSRPAGNAARGKELYEKTLRCYACHGFDAQTGSPRLVPMTRTQELFLAYVRKPATTGMPSFADAQERDLVDIYAYVRSIPQAAPALATLPILKGIVDRRTTAN